MAFSSFSGKTTHLCHHKEIVLIHTLINLQRLLLSSNLKTDKVRFFNLHFDLLNCQLVLMLLRDPLKWTIQAKDLHKFKGIMNSIILKDQLLLIKVRRLTPLNDLPKCSLSQEYPYFTLNRDLNSLLLRMILKITIYTEQKKNHLAK